MEYTYREQMMMPHGAASGYAEMPMTHSPPAGMPEMVPGPSNRFNESQASHFVPSGLQFEEQGRGARQQSDYQDRREPPMDYQERPSAGLQGGSPAGFQDRQNSGYQDRAPVGFQDR